MAINIGTLFTRILDVLNQNQTGRQLTPDMFNNDIQYLVNTYIKTKYGLPENPDPAQYYEVSDKITDDLRFLEVDLDGVTEPLLQVSNKGIAQLPDNYWHRVGGLYTDVKTKGCSKFPQERDIDFVTKDQFISRKSSPILKGTYKNPIAEVRATIIQFEPKDLQYVSFSYLRKMTTPFYDYDIINDEAVFLPTGSTHVNSSVRPMGSPSRTQDLELPDDCMDDIVYLFVPEAGIRQREPFVYQTGEARKGKGN